MEKLQGAVNPCLVGEDLDASWLDEFVSNYAFEDPYNNTEDLLPNSDDKMPFMQMLQGVESAGLASVPIIQEPNYFQLLLKLQHQKMEHPQHYYCSNFASTTEVECTVKSETCVEEHKHEHEHEHAAEFAKTMSNVAPKERRKRKRASRAMKNKEEAESQRMTHIAVERNRRRLMNDHLNALRSLMPPSYVQRGDQASIIGGAIDFVKDMEQLLQSLEGQKRMKQCHEDDNNTVVVSSTTSTTSSSNLMNNNDPIEDVGRRNNKNNKNNNNSEELSVEKRGEVGDIKVVVIQSHVNLKIECQRRPGQLMRAILGFEQLRLTILHLNITSLHTLVHYSFNLKIEDDCKLGTTDEVLKAVHHVFGLTNVH